MTRCSTMMLAALFALIAGQAAVAQSYTPAPRIVRPAVLPDPIGTRLAPGPQRKAEPAATKPAGD